MKEVIIVGGGPAGAYLAYRLARKGIDVLLLEKSSLPRSKPCAGGITEKVIQELDIDLRPVIEESITKFVFTSNFADPVEAATEEPVVHTVQREKFDCYLVLKAKKAGAEVITGARVRKIRADNGSLSVQAGERTFRGKILAGADGAHSIVARTFGLANKLSYAVTFDGHLSLSPEEAARHQGTIRADYGLLRRGYAWVFPKKDCLSVGAGAIPSLATEIRPAVQKVVQTLDHGSANPLSQARGWILPFNPFPKRLHRGPVLLLGDAAGLVNPFTGEGIYHALKSARLAAGIIAGQIRNPYPDLSEYSTLVKTEIGPELAAAFRLSRLFYRGAPYYHHLLQRRPELASDFLQLLAGRESYPRFFRRCLGLVLRESLKPLLPTG